MIRVTLAERRTSFASWLGANASWTQEHMQQMSELLPGISIPQDPPARSGVRLELGLASGAAHVLTHKWPFGACLLLRGSQVHHVPGRPQVLMDPCQIPFLLGRPVFVVSAPPFPSLPVSQTCRVSLDFPRKDQCTANTYRPGLYLQTPAGKKTQYASERLGNHSLTTLTLTNKDLEKPDGNGWNCQGESTDVVCGKGRVLPLKGCLFLSRKKEIKKITSIWIKYQCLS